MQILPLIVCFDDGVDRNQSLSAEILIHCDLSAANGAGFRQGVARDDVAADGARVLFHNRVCNVKLVCLCVLCVSACFAGDAQNIAEK